MSEETERVKDDQDDAEDEASVEIEGKADFERPTSASSSASSVISQTSPLDEDTELFERPQQGQNEDPEQVAADVSARGILKFKKSMSTDIAFRGLLMTACASDEANKTEELSDRTTGEENQPRDVQFTKDRDKDLAKEPQEFQERQEQLSTNKPSSGTSSASTVDTAEDKVSIPQNELASQLAGEQGIFTMSRPGSSNVEVVTVCTQTEWSWLQDSSLYLELLNREPDWADRRPKKPTGSVGSNRSSGLKHSRRRSSGRRYSVASDQSKDDRRSILEEATEDLLSDEPGEGEDTGDIIEIRRKSKDGSSIPKSRQSIVSSLPQTPRGQDTLFRPPTVELSSSSSSELDEGDYELQQDSLLPSIGPPAILQYIKESKHPPFFNEDVQDRSEQADMLKKSMSSGPCMFCNEEVLPFPTLEEMESLPANQLYCCPQYERLVKFELAQRGDEAHLVDKLIDIKPHPPYGTKAARRAAKERAAERAREREMDRQKAAGANPTNFYSLTRQMKTIAYSLASTKCMEEGWTVRPPSPTHSDPNNLYDPFVIEVNPLQLRPQSFLERFYEDGKRFLLLLPDGTGCCYYPSGNVAVVITGTEKGKFTYIAYEDDNDYAKNLSGMLAIFEPSGHGTCYFRNGDVRMVLNPFGGVLLDSQGARKKKWLWYNMKEHVHAPPYQPITFTISRQLSMRCLNQNKVVLTFNQGRHSVRFNVGTKLKAVTKAKPPVARDDHDLYLAEVKQFVNILLDRTQTALRLPTYPCLDKIPLPKHLQKIKDGGKRGKLRSTQTSRQQDPTTVIVN